MKTTAKRSIALLLLVAMVLGGLGVLGYRFAVNGEKWATLRANEHLTENGSFVGAGNVLDRNGEVLAFTENGERNYNNSERIRKSTLHIVGDTEGYISSGVQTAYKSQLSGYSPLTGFYTLERYGKGNDVVLTIDSKVSAVAYDALKGRKGVVAAYNYKTGEILCSVSSPNYDIEDKPSAEDIEKNKDGKYDGLYLNRLIDGLYTPGSTFKVITSISALQNIPDIHSFQYKCTGEEVVDGVKVTCPKKHGEMDFHECFSSSCNCAFAVMSQEIGSLPLEQTARELGFGEVFLFGNKNTAASIIDLAAASGGDLAWASVGQYDTLVNPYHMLTLMGAVANKGDAVLPFAVESVVSPKGRVVEKAEPEVKSYITPVIADEISQMMREAVEDKYGDGNFENLSMCGKTGTAEVEDGKKPHSWFVGFSQNEQCPIAIVVVVENGGWGSSTALPVASKVMKEIYKSVS
ncbi:MAG: penicillin-binding protein [Clostridia bacterium]|nr:penicillin-binding protein [Clostridia bacterium]